MSTPAPRPRSARPRPTRAVLAGLTLTVALAVAGCADQAGSGGSSTRSAASEPASSAPTEATSAATETMDATPSSPSASMSTAEPPTSVPSPSTSPSTTAAHARSLRSRLLPAADLPGFNDEFQWHAGRTRSGEHQHPFGTCQRFELSDIGALRSVVRTFRPPGAGSHDIGRQLVAAFPDDATARRAFEVLKSWRTTCGDRLAEHDHSHVGRLQSVSLANGTGAWFLLSYGPVPSDADAQWYDAQGMALVGSRIALVRLAMVGQDYNYDAGEEPMVAAVQRAAARLS